MKIKLKHISKKGKNLLCNTGMDWEIIKYRDKVICLNNKPGFLLLCLSKESWFGLWISKYKDPDFEMDIV